MPGPDGTLNLAQSGSPADEDRRFMAEALRLGRAMLGRVWPNPAVGCVIVREGRIVGRGWTQPGGRPHAERVALDDAGPAASGATVYVTLEPCCHWGRTPPCAEAIIAAGVARVVASVTDPDPRVNGGGFARLREAGIAVEIGLGVEEAIATHAGFFHRLRHGTPLVEIGRAACACADAILSSAPHLPSPPLASLLVTSPQGREWPVVVTPTHASASAPDGSLPVSLHHPDADALLRALGGLGLTRLALDTADPLVALFCESSRPCRVGV